MKTTICSLLILVFLAATSCTVDVPDSDTNSPDFSLTIIGDGFNHTFDQDDDFSTFELNLNQQTTYNFTFTGRDSGGVNTMAWLWDGSPNFTLDVNYSEDLSSGWYKTSRYDDEGPGDGINFKGDVDQARAMVALPGTFSANHSFEGDLPTYFTLRVSDFGGTDGEANTVEKMLKVNVLFENGPTELVPLNAQQ